MTPLDRFIARWFASGDAERANKNSFLNELCDVLGVERPHPKTGFAERDLYVFEKDVARTRAGGTSVGRVDLYKHGCFLLEAKQGAATDRPQAARLAGLVDDERSAQVSGKNPRQAYPLPLFAGESG